MKNGEAESDGSNNVEFAFNPQKQRVTAAFRIYWSLLPQLYMNYTTPITTQLTDNYSGGQMIVSE